MQLSKQTVDVLKSFSGINTNLVVKSGKTISTMASSKDIIATYIGEDEFTKPIAIFNLNEFLGVHAAFDKPELTLDDKFMTFSQGKQKVKYVYAAPENLITSPEKAITFPKADIEFDLSEQNLAKLYKMGNVLGVNDFAIVGDGSSIVLRVFDIANPTDNVFDLDIEVETDKEFEIHYKLDKMKLYAGGYKVEVSSKKISRFTHSTLNLVYYIAVESSSTFS